MTLTRRELMQGAALAAASLAAGAGRAGAADPGKPAPLRKLGRTGMMVTPVAFGAMNTGEAPLVRYAVDNGINYIDTADCYMGGRNERIVGEAVKGVRDKVLLASKVHLCPVARMVESVERSLSNLAVERIDLMQIHGVSSQGEIGHQEAKEALTLLKKQGKIRFAGVTTHGGQTEVVNAVAADGFYDTVLVACSFLSPPDLWEAVAAASRKGVGIVAMKTQNGGYSTSPWPGLTPHQAALRFVLEKEGVACAVPGVVHTAQVDELLGSLRPASPVAHALQLELMDSELRGRACAFCGECRRQCGQAGRGGGGPAGGMEAVRVAMYLDGYRDPRLARERGAEVREEVARCATCPSCTVTCPRGIDIPARARRAAEVLDG